MQPDRRVTQGIGKRRQGQGPTPVPDNRNTVRAGRSLVRTCPGQGGHGKRKCSAPPAPAPGPPAAPGAPGQCTHALTMIVLTDNRCTDVPRGRKSVQVWLVLPVQPPYGSIARTLVLPEVEVKGRVWIGSRGRPPGGRGSRPAAGTRCDHRSPVGDGCPRSVRLIRHTGGPRRSVRLRKPLCDRVGPCDGSGHPNPRGRRRTPGRRRAVRPVSDLRPGIAPGLRFHSRDPLTTPLTGRWSRGSGLRSLGARTSGGGRRVGDADVAGGRRGEGHHPPNR